VIDGAVKHTEHLGDEADGRRTVEDFLGVFTPALEKEKSVSAAWDEVQRRLPYRPPRGSKERPAAETWSGIGGLVLAAALCVFAGAGARRLTPYAANKDLETRIVRPGYGVKLYLGDPVRSIGARWRGESPRFDLEVGDPAFVDSVVAHADVWDADITEMRSGGKAPPSFRPMMEIRLKDDPRLSGQTLIGTASLTAVYPTFSGVAFREASLPLDKKIEIRVFTFPQVLLARAAPLFYTAGAILVILTAMAMIGRLRCEETEVSPGE
jgi:hypothetical protein